MKYICAYNPVGKLAYLHYLDEGKDVMMASYKDVESIIENGLSKLLPVKGFEETCELLNNNESRYFIGFDFNERIIEKIKQRKFSYDPFPTNFSPVLKEIYDQFTQNGYISQELNLIFYNMILEGYNWEFTEQVYESKIEKYITEELPYVNHTHVATVDNIEFYELFDEQHLLYPIMFERLSPIRPHHKVIITSYPSMTDAVVTCVRNGDAKSDKTFNELVDEFVSMETVVQSYPFDEVPTVKRFFIDKNELGQLFDDG